jgi:hypothetical protein
MTLTWLTTPGSDEDAAAAFAPPAQQTSATIAPASVT